MNPASFVLPATFADLLILIVGLLILWIIVSIPVYVAGKLVTAGRADFGQALGSTLGGGLVYFLVFYGVAFFLGALLGPTATIFALILALAAWVAVYRASFSTSWLGALGIVVVAWAVLVILDLFVGRIFGVAFPEFWPW
jgi:hypothetical protein